MGRPIVKVTSDFICPWCWIGHRNLKSALAQIDAEHKPEISYVPFELNPSLPLRGVDRKEYRTRKFGSWNRSVLMDADVTAAGKAVGAEFNYEKVTVTPNTLLAHRLMVFAQRKGDTKRTEALFEGIFTAYFSRGENIGLVDVLVEVANGVGFDAGEVSDFLLSDDGKAEVVAKEMDAQRDGVRGVPSFTIGGSRIHGAQPTSVLKDVISTEASDVELDNASDTEANDCTNGSCQLIG
ncbi:DSBA oxidoreductase [Caballeronia calidae]|uniref:DSBA oxidoreductase n=1 Tax=Caballeronia calidae TaxID=1777139 RepID=A0A158ECK4_9BURK|nr:DsbA family oxidoreductase [Caballeronia calidae]SAL04460.1 DSBA oxidoreductase [Caballeronia calidae]